jgi:hypothetical protein
MGFMAFSSEHEAATVQVPFTRLRRLRRRIKKAMLGRSGKNASFRAPRAKPLI